MKHKDFVYFFGIFVLVNRVLVDLQLRRKQKTCSEQKVKLKATDSKQSAQLLSPLSAHLKTSNWAAILDLFALVLSDKLAGHRPCQNVRQNSIRSKMVSSALKSLNI